MPGTLFVVATPIGNLEDITMRALRVLRDVSLIAAEDTRRTAHLLARYEISTPTTSLHAHNEGKKSPSLIARMGRGDSVALVSDAGTPTISDPGQRLVRAALEAGLRVDPIPGASAVTATLAASGLPADEFTFLGFPPIRSKDRSRWMADLTAARHTVVFFEAPHRIKNTLKEILKFAGDHRIVVGRELTKIHGELVYRPISSVLESLETGRGEYTIALDIGHMANSLGDRPGESEIRSEHLGQSTESAPATRRQLIADLAASCNLTPNQLYQAIEQAKKQTGKCGE
jgi:16S rRNA (cytidine1402-2'-O)-methyltransferase